VWFEAPIGYISMTADLLGEDYKKWWHKQKDTNVELRQFMGKDNVVFHSILCPTILRGTKGNWTLPSHISATEHLMYEGGKFSKSQNIGIFGDQCI
jgi:methionyl-tRNA synthetase